MSIDARVKRVVRHQNGTGKLLLVNRPPAREGELSGIRGQSELRFDAAPANVHALAGWDVWGSSETLILGNIQIAKRLGYTVIAFVPEAEFNRAVAAYQELLLKRAAREAAEKAAVPA